MARYVDIDKPIIVTIYNDPFDDKKTERITTTIAELLQTTVDVLEEDIVRCKDCERHDSYNCPMFGWANDDFFCGAGERKVEG